MFGLSEIRRLSNEAARKAAKANRQPLMIHDGSTAGWPPIPIPNLGDYRPKGWNLIDTLFVDSSGMGLPGEGAMTADEFLKRVRLGYGYAIVETGQFQVCVGEFEKTGKSQRKETSKCM